MGELDISVNSTTVATLTVDHARVSGGGGALSPFLQISFDAEAAPRPDGAAIGVERVTVELWLPRPTPPRRLGQPATHWWPGGSFCSTHRGVNRTFFELRFQLTFDEVRLFEAEAARVEPNILELELRGDVAVGWIKWVGNSIDNLAAVSLPPSIQPLGLLSQIHPFWSAQLRAATLYLTREQLAQNILPDMGLDRVRLVAVRLPTDAGPLPRKIVGEFDAARRDYDAGRYREAIAKCRDLRVSIETVLGATDRDGERVADHLAKRATVGPGLFALIEKTWTGLVVATNEAHHPQETSAFTATSARTCLMLTAVMVEAISEVLAPREF